MLLFSNSNFSYFKMYPKYVSKLFLTVFASRCSSCAEALAVIGVTGLTCSVDNTFCLYHKFSLFTMTVTLIHFSSSRILHPVYSVSVLHRAACLFLASLALCFAVLFFFFNAYSTFGVAVVLRFLSSHLAHNLLRQASSSRPV